MAYKVFTRRRDEPHRVCVFCFADGVGERLRGYRNADASRRERGEAVLPLLARRGIQPVPHLRGKMTQLEQI